MDKKINLLSGLLVLQLLLALWAFSGGSDLSAQRPDEPLLGFDKATVIRIKIEGPDGAAVTLSKTDEGWFLPDAWDVPVKDGKVGHLLNRLQHLKQGLPVATTAGAQVRFEVAEDKFQRRITLSTGPESMRVLYLGTSPGMRMIHARMAVAETVYATSFAAYEAPYKADDWLDTRLVQIDDSALQAIEINGLTLTKARSTNEDDKATEKPVWTASGLAEGDNLDLQQANKLAASITALEVSKVLGIEAVAGYRQDSPELELSLMRTGSGSVSWVMSKPEQGDAYVLKSSDRPWYFEVPAWAANPLLQATKDLVRKSPIPPAEPDISENGANNATSRLFLPPQALENGS